jgi:GT2 family glycosyltransferase
VTIPAIPRAEHPLVSVVMVTYGGKEWITRSLQALVANTACPYELIVVDNASPDDTPSLLRTVRGATLLFNDSNVGFGPGCNQGALHAAGPFVCLLNSDAIVEPGWVEPLVETLERDPSAAAAVPRLLHLDGTLQEAAGVVGVEGATRALGDGDDPEKLEYRFRRYVDYGSAACMLIRRSAFLRVGGFDPAYPMGYCEDVDLCFALRELGLRTVYEPRSRVRHVRWGSSSRAEADRRVFANQPILLARWGERLAGRPSFREVPPPVRRLLQARDAAALDRLLVVTDAAWGHPSAPLRLAAVATEVQEALPEARVTVLAGAAAATERVVEPLLGAGVEVAVEDDWGAWLEARRFHYSAVLLSGPTSFERFEALVAAAQPQAVRIYDVDGLVHRRLEQMAGWTRDAAGRAGLAAVADRIRASEIGAAGWAEVLFCGCEGDLAFARDVAPGTAAFVLAGAGDPDPLAEAVGFESRHGALVIGDLPLALTRDESELLGRPLRAALEALAAAAPGIGVLAPPGPAERPARVHLAPPPVGADALTGSIAAGVPFVTWPGAASELELGDLASRVVAGDPADVGRLASALHGDRGLWEEVRRDLLGISRGRAAAHGRGLWRGLAHCGMAPAPARPAAGPARAQLGESQRADGLQGRRGRNGQGP